jgi:hypothetical protein
MCSQALRLLAAAATGAKAPAGCLTAASADSCSPPTFEQQRSSFGHELPAFAGSNSLKAGHTNWTPGSLMGVTSSQELGCSTGKHRQYSDNSQHQTQCVSMTRTQCLPAAAMLCLLRARSNGPPD